MDHNLERLMANLEGDPESSASGSREFEDNWYEISRFCNNSTWISEETKNQPTTAESTEHAEVLMQASMSALIENFSDAMTYGLNVNATNALTNGTSSVLAPQLGTWLSQHGLEIDEHSLQRGGKTLSDIKVLAGRIFQDLARDRINAEATHALSIGTSSLAQQHGTPMSQQGLDVGARTLSKNASLLREILRLRGNFHNFFGKFLKDIKAAVQATHLDTTLFQQICNMVEQHVQQNAGTQLEINAMVDRLEADIARHNLNVEATRALTNT